ncbi:unnamed protein product [Brachionus calyciflorus]|uniref:MULE transposase domain-containing protein n=1 Tax=Brachionus calyciflorus TaxID=104777 RepID=A0A814CMT1_9BILA|nr:unnamed protein product [Brachionus calyciflorus]
MEPKVIENLKKSEIIRSPRVLRSRTIPRPPISIVTPPESDMLSTSSPLNGPISLPASNEPLSMPSYCEPVISLCNNLINLNCYTSDSESENEYEAGSIELIDYDSNQPVLAFSSDELNGDDENLDDGDDYLSKTIIDSNEDVIDNPDLQLSFVPSNRGGPKLCFQGYYYTIDKNLNVEEPKSFSFEDKFYANGDNVINWKCENANDTKTTVKCMGRVHTIGFNCFGEYRREHNHLPNHEKKYCLLVNAECKNQAKLTNYDPNFILKKAQVKLPEVAASQMLRPEAIRQTIRRVRITIYGQLTNPGTLQEIEIPNTLTYTYTGKKFFWDDSGRDDPNRIILFTTNDNLKRLDQHKHWYIDGTFDITPYLFKQVFSVHIIVNNKVLPMVYALVPNKTQVSYTKLFRMLKSSLNECPLSISSDFELAIINSIEEVFPNCKPQGCYFHLCQSLWRQVQTIGLVEAYNSYASFRRSFKLVQALPFLPVEEVINGLKIIKTCSNQKFKPILSYFERNYIGKINDKSKGIRDKPRFSIGLWSVYERVLHDLPRTNNAVESWHSKISSENKKHLSVFKIIEMFRLEEKNTNIRYIQLSSGEVPKRKNKSIQKDEAIKNTLKNFDPKLIKEYLCNIGQNLN